MEKKLNIGSMKIYFEQFSGINEFVRTVEKREIPEQWQGKADITNEGELPSPSFRGYRYYADARKALLEGRNVEAMKKARADGLGDYMKVKTVRTDRGSLPCIPAYLSNDPRAMYARKPQRTKGAYNVFVDIGVHCGITCEQIKEAGARILTYITRLEQEQPVNLYVGFITNTGNKYDMFSVKIKDAGKPFNASRVSFALTDPAMLRIFNFMWQERNENTHPSDGHGRPTTKAERDKICEKLFKNTICVGMMEEVEKGR